MVGEQQELSLEQLGSWLGYADDSIIEQGLARFLCSRNTEVEEFLHSSAIAFAKSSIARTYLLATEQIFFVENVPKNQLCASFFGSALRQ